MMAGIASFFGYLLNWLYNLVQNYGLAIILFSLLLKLIMIPLSYKQQVSMKKNAKLQEELNKIKLKFKNNPEMLNKETMELYRREKVSPFSGCLTSILQIIIFISVFYLVSSPLTYMKKIDSSVIEKYKNAITTGSTVAITGNEVIENTTLNEAIKNETKVENNVENTVENNNNNQNNTNTSYIEIKIIELFGNENKDVYLNMNFLGLNLSKVPTQNLNDWKVYIIPAIYVALTFVNIKMTSKMTEKKKKENEVESKEIIDGKEEDKKDDTMESMNQMTKSMNLMMPIMSVGIALIAPLGLSLYWAVSNALQLIEKIIIDRIIKEDNV